MPRNKNGRTTKTIGPETQDLIEALNAIYIDHSVSAEIHAYMALDGRMFVECIADVYVSGSPLLHVSQGRYVPSTPNGVLSAALMAVHAVYHEIDRLEARRLASK